MSNLGALEYLTLLRRLPPDVITTIETEHRSEHLRRVTLKGLLRAAVKEIDRAERRLVTAMMMRS
jgi:hypothetical protein